MSVSNLTSVMRTGVCTSTTRPSAPYQGQVIYETDTAKTLVWNGSAWVFLSTSTANPVGMELIASQTIGSAVPSVTVSSCFSAAYDKYQVNWYVATQSATANAELYFNASGNNYYTQGWYQQPTSSTMTVYGTGAGASSIAVIGVWQSGFGSANGTFVVHSPFLTERTFLVHQSSAPGYMWWGQSQVADTVSNTGFVFRASTGTMSGGTIRVYGFRN